jgi:DNA polymerase V
MGVHQVTELAVDSDGLVRIPFVGQAICAGFPSPADDFLEGALDLPRWLAPNPPASFLLNVSGESMIDAGIHDRDVVLVDRSLKAGPDSVVVVCVDGQFSIKRLVLDGNRLKLAFANRTMPAYAVEEFAEVDLWGVVRFNIRWHVARNARGKFASR